MLPSSSSSSEHPAPAASPALLGGREQEHPPGAADPTSRARKSGFSADGFPLRGRPDRDPFKRDEFRAFVHRAASWSLVRFKKQRWSFFVVVINTLLIEF